MSLISGDCSATGMNSFGGTTPWPGRSHRINASRPSTRTGHQIDDRLVVQHELALVQSLPDRRLQLGPFAQLYPQQVVEHLDPVPAAFLAR